MWFWLILAFKILSLKKDLKKFITVTKIVFVIEQVSYFRN